MAAGFADLNKRLMLVERELSGEAARRRLAAVGQASKPDIVEAVRGDLGDLSMSGWRRQKPIEITGRYEVTGDGTMEMAPAKRARGPMRVLESGRQASSVGERRQSGSYKSKRTGAVTARYRTTKRNTGATQGKGTWTDATNLLERRMPARWERAWVKDIGRHLRGG